MATILINIADLTDPDDPQGRSYRQINATKQHKIPLGTLVELDNGVRLFVVRHTRDCDETPLYTLSTEPNEEDRGPCNLMHGYAEDSFVRWFDL